MHKLTLGSLFTGIGGLDIGLENSGMQVSWQVEKNEYCRNVLEKRWPEINRWDDVKTFPPGPADDWKVDVIAGGFPCQDISNAGLRKGLSGNRSGLWFEMLRVICFLRPKFIVLENVPALLIRGFGDVLGGLAEAGYDAEWQVLSASMFGAPHIRERIFIIAYPNGFRFQGWTYESERSEMWEDGKKQLARFLQTGVRVDIPEIGFFRMDDGSSNRMDRVRALGNAVVPYVAESIGRSIVQSAQKYLY
ncbi:MAG: DNA cytosine methyltransferase [Pseudomonadota bacterium]